MAEIFVNADELEAEPDVRGIRIGDVIVVGSHEDIFDLLRRIADNLGECGATVEWRDPGPDRDRFLALQAFGVTGLNVPHFDFSVAKVDQ